VRDARNAATALMKPAAEDVLQMWAVSRWVNSSRADGEEATLVAEISS
jgi:putative SOS response-associated peptidase YedK